MADSKEVKYWTETGVSGLEAFGGYVYQDPLRVLQGVNGSRIFFQMMENDPAVGAMMFAIKALIKQVKWIAQPASDSPEDQANADFLEECMGDMEYGFDDYVDEMLGFLGYGFSITEICYKKRNGYKRDPSEASKYNDGRYGWKKLAGRSQISITNGQWDMSENNAKVNGVWQRPDTGGEFYIPMEKIIHLRTTIRNNNPEGRSILRSAYRPWYIKTRIENYEAIGVERDLAGLPVISCPADWFNPASPYRAQLEELKNIATNVRRDEQEGIVLPNMKDVNGNPMIEFKLMASSGQRQFNTGEIINRKNQEILMTTLADFLVLGHNNVGSNALAFTKAEVFQTALQSWVDIVIDGFNTQAIPKLMRLNGFNGDMPRLASDGMDKIDTAMFINNLKQLSDIGYGSILDESVEDKLRNMLDLPPAERMPNEERVIVMPGQEENAPMLTPAQLTARSQQRQAQNDMNSQERHQLEVGAMAAGQGEEK
jgi:hypothetical protein